MYEYFDFDYENAMFDWDDVKEELNFRKHGIHFLTAAKVFLDPQKLIRADEEHTAEERYNILGKVGKILFVVCAFEENGIIRIISARKASEPEKERYNHGENFYE
jgi:uncharacterized DUF497 family protein